MKKIKIRLTKIFNRLRNNKINNNFKILYTSPSIKTLDEFLSIEECNKLIEISKNDLTQALVGRDKKNVLRTGRNCFIKPKEKDWTNKILKRICKTFNESESDAGSFQIVKYKINETYAYHYDAFPKNEFRSNLMPKDQNSYQRKSTIICYLNRCEKGGETFFPKQNIKVETKVGRMLYFSNVKKNTMERDLDSLHAGLPVLKGEKWILVLWFISKKVTQD